MCGAYRIYMQVTVVSYACDHSMHGHMQTSQCGTLYESHTEWLYTSSPPIPLIKSVEGYYCYSHAYILLYSSDYKIQATITYVHWVKNH